MPGYEENRSISGRETALLEQMDEGAFCETTRRIVIVSPFPASVRSLVISLTTRCYDVLVFHYENDPILAALQCDLMIVDRTKNPAVEHMESQLDVKTKRLFLVSSASQPVPQNEEVVVWPAPLAPVLHRIERLVERSEGASAASPLAAQLRVKDVVMDLKRFTVHQDGQKRELTRTEFDLLRVLVEGGGVVLTRQQIMDRLWGDDYYGGSNSVDVHIKSLRQKLGDDPKRPRYITTVRGVGYRLAD